MLHDGSIIDTVGSRQVIWNSVKGGYAVKNIKSGAFISIWFKLYTDAWDFALDGQELTIDGTYDNLQNLLTESKSIRFYDPKKSPQSHVASFKSNAIMKTAVKLGFEKVYANDNGREYFYGSYQHPDTCESIFIWNFRDNSEHIWNFSTGDPGYAPLESHHLPGLGFKIL